MRGSGHAFEHTMILYDDNNSVENKNSCGGLSFPFFKLIRGYFVQKVQVLCLYKGEDGGGIGLTPYGLTGNYFTVLAKP